MSACHLLLAHIHSNHHRIFGMHQLAIGIVVQVDKKLEDALRTAVRRSLQEMSRALNGDKRLEVAPLFIVSLHLDDTKRIELRPTVQVITLPQFPCRCWVFVAARTIHAKWIVTA